jgi:subtilase family serine protease
MVLIVGTFTVYINMQAHASRADTLVPLPDMVPKVVTQSKLVGPANTQQTIALAFDLRLRNATELDSYIADMNTPKSVNYHHNLSQAQLIGAFSPTQATQDALLHYLQQSGFTITHTFKHRLVISFKGLPKTKLSQR